MRKNSDMLTPMLFQIPFGQRPDRYPAETSQPLNHNINLREITRVESVSSITNYPSSELRSLIATRQINLHTWVTADYELVALSFYQYIGCSEVEIATTQLTVRNRY